MEINLFITGDYCPIGRNETKILNGDFSMIEAIKPYSQNVDLAITNLEAPITESNAPIKKSGPNIKANYKSLEPLLEAGFSLVTLANNHILDFGENGVKDTIKNCDDKSIHYVGAGCNLAYARNLKIIEIKNKKIGVLNYAESEFCAATLNSYGANPVNLIQNHRDIKRAKEQVDFLLVIAHGGREHYQLPTPNQRERYRFYIESGADTVVGHHPHCFSGYEVYNKKPIFYSLGNFIFDYKKKYQKGHWTKGFGLKLTIKDNNISFKLIPFHQGRFNNSNIELFNNEEEKLFFEEIKALNEIILDDSLYLKNWDDYINTQRINYKGMLFLQNKYIRAAVTKGLLPRWFFHSKQHQTLLLNMFRCETHREISMAVLEKDYNNI